MLLEHELMPHWIRGGTACVSDNVVIKWEECKAYAARRAGVVLEDDQYRKISGEDLQRLHEVTPAGTPELPVKIAVDEAQDPFYVRDFADKGKRPFFSWLCQSRHDDNDVILLSQASANLDKSVRRLATFYWVVRNTDYFPVGGKPLSYWFRLFSFGLSSGQFFIRTQLDQDGKTAFGKTWHKADRGLFGCYESKAMRLKHRRAGEAVARKKLAQVKGKARPAVVKYVLLGLVVLIGWSACKLFKGDSKSAGAKASSERHEFKAEAPKVEKPRGYLDGDVVRATLRCSGYSGEGRPMLGTAEFGLMVEGETYELGRVERILGRRAVVKVSGGVTIIVEGFSGAFVGPSASPVGGLGIRSGAVVAPVSVERVEAAKVRNEERQAAGFAQSRKRP
jgi:hypothetical protein